MALRACGLLLLGAALPTALADEGFLRRCARYAADHDALPEQAYLGAHEDRELVDLLARATPADIRACLADGDARMRTLGVLAIGHGDDPSLLPLLVPLLDDRARTFDQTLRVSVALLERDGRFVPSGPPTRLEPGTVARVASLVLQEWTGLTNPTPGQFAAYWAEVEQPEHLVAVWAHRFRKTLSELRAWAKETRAGRDAWEREALARTRRLKDRLSRDVPGPVQVAVALTVGDDVNFASWTEEEQAALAAEHLGPERALDILARKPPFRDPWVAPGSAIYGALRRRLLLLTRWEARHSKVLLDLEAAEQGREDGMRSSAWAIAAARASGEPGRARTILRDAFGRLARLYDDAERWRLANELWDVAGPEEMAFLVERFFAEMEPRTNGAGYQGAVAQHVAESAQPGQRRFLRTIVTDARFASVRWAPLLAVARACNRVAEEPIIPEQELEGLHHPMGAYHFSRAEEPGAAEAKHPAETARVLDALAGWRRRLRDHAIEHRW